jgi:D-alanyl-D-alanine carboxypeptidase
MTKYCAFLVAAISLASAVPVTAAPLSPQQQAAIDAIARRQLAVQHIAGLTIAVGRNGSVLYARGYGLRDRARKLPADAGTAYAIGSITKQFTAAAVMLLAQSGDVDPNAKLARYLPRVRHADRVTVHDLLDQISGLQDYLVDKPLLQSIENGTIGHHSIAYYVNIGANLPLDFPPGSKWAYSNTNYAALGLLIERVSGQPYQRFLANEIFQSRLRHTTYLTTSSLPPGNDASQGYTFAKGSFSLVKPYDMSWANAAGALSSTAGDLITWDGLFFGGRILDRATLQTALRAPKNRPLLPSKDERNNIAQSYASGWVHGQDEGRDLIWHNGGTIGYRTMNLVFPDGLEVIVLTNATDGKPEPIALQVARMLYGRGR